MLKYQQVNLFKNQPLLVPTDESHFLMSFIKNVIFKVNKYNITKKMTAEGVCQGPVSFESIVPIAIVKVNIAKYESGSIQEDPIFPGY
jgi:hypothetical protein